jgi:hypothetical protein
MRSGSRGGAEVVEREFKRSDSDRRAATARLELRIGKKRLNRRKQR